MFKTAHPVLRASATAILELAPQLMASVNTFMAPVSILIYAMQLSLTIY